MACLGSPAHANLGFPWGAFSTTSEELIVERRLKRPPECLTALEEVPIERPPRRSRTRSNPS